MKEPIDLLIEKIMAGDLVFNVLISELGGSSGVMFEAPLLEFSHSAGDGGGGGVDLKLSCANGHIWPAISHEAQAERIRELEAEVANLREEIKITKEYYNSELLNRSL